MLELILWVVIVIVIYLGYEIFVIRKEKVLKNMENGNELRLLKKKYKLDYSKLNMKRVVRMVAITNALILSTVVSIASLLRNFTPNLLLWTLSVFLTGMILLTPMILICYSIIGRKLVKLQGGKK